MSESLPRVDAHGPDSRLVESEERYRAVIENASDMIQSCRPDGTFEFVNRAWLEKLGYAPGDLASMTVWDIIHPDSLDHCMEFFGRAIGGEEIEALRAIFVTKDGKPLPVEGNATSRFLDGEVVATHSFFRDITERLRAEELEERNAQLEQERLARYLEKMAALGKLAAGLAHELNNPAAAAERAGSQLSESVLRRDAALAHLHDHNLTVEQWAAIHAFIAATATDRLQPGTLRPTEVSRLESEIEDWLQDHGIDEGWDMAAALVQDGVDAGKLDALAASLPEDSLPHVLVWLSEASSASDLVNVVARSSQRISELVAAVKAYSFMDRAVEQIVDVHDGIENTLVILGYRLRGITVQREYDRSLPEVRAFGSGLNQVWTNIIDNAVDALGGEGIITIRTRRADDGRVVVEIEDNGPGIPQENQSRVFEPFFSTKQQGEGTGLGLDTAWRIVTEEHGGSIELESQPGLTLFRVALPTRAAASSQAQRPEQ